MFPRAMTVALREVATKMPVVTVTGPRQSGKTTLARSLFSDKPYCSLESPDFRRQALEDPRGFLARFPDGAILDEVQRVPEILSYLQGIVDASGRPGMFILTGSANFTLLKSVSQSLAGRTIMADLLPMSLAELCAAGFGSLSMADFMYRGGYPRIYDVGMDASILLRSYVANYLERDVRDLLNIRDLHQFDLFLRLCASRSGQILNVSSLCNDCGVSHGTGSAWLSVLETSYIIHFVRPHHRNFGKRLVKSPKMYFWDVGLMCNLLGVQAPEQAALHPLRGAMFETLVVSELLKARLNALAGANAYFFADSVGHEVDVIVERALDIVPIEIKSAQTLTDDLLKSLQYYARLNPAGGSNATLIYGGEEELTYKGVRVVNFRNAAGANPLV